MDGQAKILFRDRELGEALFAQVRVLRGGEVVEIHSLYYHYAVPVQGVAISEVYSDAPLAWNDDVDEWLDSVLATVREVLALGGYSVEIVTNDPYAESVFREALGVEETPVE